MKTITIEAKILDNHTKYIQDLINNEAYDSFIFTKGIYNLEPIFLKSNSKYIFNDGVIFNTIINEKNIELINTRVAGINMPWYPGVINLLNLSNVEIEGKLTLEGNGEYFYHKYWGTDTLGGMREVYDKNNLRWACDYDCMRLRGLLVQNSSNISIKDITIKNSGFWNLHILYSNNILIDNVVIDSKNKNSPSTDGIDIDSSSKVIVKNSTINTNDDSICIKSGRDYDGYTTNIPSHDIEISNCTLNDGFGLTFGSEISGGIYNVTINNINFNGTDCGIRIKSARPRRGYLKDVEINNLKMNNVKYLFHFNLDWNPLYSYCEIPENYKGEIKEHYVTLTKRIPNNIPLTSISDISISNVVSLNTSDYKGISRVFNIEGYKENPISNLKFSNLDIYAIEFGKIECVNNLLLNNTNITIKENNNSENDEYDNR